MSSNPSRISITEFVGGFRAMPRTKATNVRTDRINSILREIARSKLPLESIEMLPAGKTVIKFYRVFEEAERSWTPSEADRALERWRKRQSQRANS